jgi:serine protease
MRTHWVVSITFMAVTAVVGAATLNAERNNARVHPHTTLESSVHEVIVKLRAPAAGGRVQAQAVNAQSAQERILALTQRAGLGLDLHRPITELLHAIRVEPAVTGETLAATLARLRADPEVEYAEPDQRRYIHSAPNDPQYPSSLVNGNGQWYLQPSSASAPSAVDAQTAWNTTQGSSTLVIADIDTGVRADHPDLQGRLLPGYCFISTNTPEGVFVNNGGSCPGPGALDPGDWITSSDATSSPGNVCSGAMAEPSSWHGTRVAGVLGANTNNGIGVAGVTWSAQILPVRAVGKCGGADSDIISGMLWAAGIAVQGAPNNPNPAKIINLSLGGTGACPSSYMDAIKQLTAMGVLIVVSAGNEEGVPVDAPANCPGVAAVAGIRQAGTKVGFSNIGPEVALSAPAGNCVNTGNEQPCLYTITTTTNLGSTTPDTSASGNDYTGQYYCDSNTGSYPGCTVTGTQYRTYNVGTSFAAPVVSGIAALMSSVNKNLNSCQLIARLKEGAQAFPQSSASTTTMCHVPSGANDTQDECICTLDGKTCGAGMANAPGAVTAALRPVAAINPPTSVASGQSITLDGSGSAAANSHTISTYQWSNGSGGVMPAIQNATSAKATLNAPSCGIATVSLTVTDEGGRVDTANIVITPTSATTSAPTSAGQAACSTTPAAVQIAVCPGTGSVVTSATQAFSASLANTTNSSVTWEVNGVPGGNTTVGTISSSGVYTAPASVPSPSTVTISAVSAADTTASASSQVTVTTPPKSGGGGGAIEVTTLLMLAGALLAVARRPQRARRT